MFRAYFFLLSSSMGSPLSLAGFDSLVKFINTANQRPPQCLGDVFTMSTKAYVEAERLAIASNFFRLKIKGWSGQVTKRMVVRLSHSSQMLVESLLSTVNERALVFIRFVILQNQCPDDLSAPVYSWSRAVKFSKESLSNQNRFSDQKLP